MRKVFKLGILQRAIDLIEDENKAIYEKREEDNEDLLKTITLLKDIYQQIEIGELF